MEIGQGRKRPGRQHILSAHRHEQQRVAPEGLAKRFIAGLHRIVVAEKATAAGIQLEATDLRQGKRRCNRKRQEPRAVVPHDPAPNGLEATFQGVPNRAGASPVSPRFHEAPFLSRHCFPNASRNRGWLPISSVCIRLSGDEGFAQRPKEQGNLFRFREKDPPLRE